MPRLNNKNNTYKFPLEVKTAVIQGKSYSVKNAKLLTIVHNEEKTPFKIKYGDNVLLKGTLSTPAAAVNPSQFDYQGFLQNKGILKTFYAKSGDCKYIGAPVRKNFNRYFTRIMYDTRDRAIKEHSKYIPSPHLEILGGVVFGDEAVNSPDEVKNSFINSGLLHLLAASGLNVAFILSMWLCLIYFLNLPYRLKIVSGMAVVFLYTVMTGFPPSIVRASVMLF